jgi:hypothetical protein
LFHHPIEKVVESSSSSEEDDDEDLEDDGSSSNGEDGSSSHNGSSSGNKDGQTKYVRKTRGHSSLSRSAHPTSAPSTITRPSVSLFVFPRKLHVLILALRDIQHIGIHDEVMICEEEEYVFFPFPYHQRKKKPAAAAESLSMDCGSGKGSRSSSSKLSSASKEDLKKPGGKDEKSVSRFLIS